MDKFSELKAAAMAATPGPWEWFTSNSMARLSSTPSGKDGDVLSAFRASDGVPCVSVSQHDMAFIAAANPAAVLVLLAERDSNQQNYHNAMEELRIERAQRQAADQRIAELEAYNATLRDWNAGLAQESCELQAKLATPVRLPTQEFYDDPLSAHLAIKDCANAIRVAGFIIDAGNGQPEEETPLAKMARIIRENPHPTNECDMPPAEGDE